MTVVGMFEVSGDPQPEHLDMVRDVAFSGFPWERMLPYLRTYNRTRFLVVFREMRDGVLGEAIAGRVTMTPDWRHNTPAVFGHEMGHLVDSALHFRPGPRGRDGREAWDAATHAADPCFPGIRWYETSIHHSQRPGEGYGEWFTNFLGLSQRTSYGPHSWHDQAARHQLEDLLDEGITAMPDTFDDVPDDYTHLDAIEWAARQGLVTGYPDGTFRPTEPVTRAQLCSILHRQAHA